MRIKRTVILLGALLLMTAAAAAAEVRIVPSTHQVQVNGQPVSPQAYNIDGYNYFKLRDIASLLNGTASSFDVTWDAATQAVDLLSGRAYTAVGGELTSVPAESLRVQSSTAKVLLDGSGVEMQGYNINGNNYYKIADVSAAVGFAVGFENTTKTVQIKTATAPAPDPEQEPAPAPEPVPEPEPAPEPAPAPEPEPVPVFQAGVYQVKVDTFLTIRTGPGTHYTMSGRLDNGAEIVVDSITDGWAHLYAADSTASRYCSADYLIRMRDYTIEVTDEPAPEPPPEPRTSHLDGRMTVIVDAGHGGKDIGAHNADKTLDEKHINLYVAQYLRQYLEQAGVHVIMVRETLEEGSSLSLRGTVMEQYAESADLFFSIHHNAANTVARGAEMLAQVSDKEGGPSYLLAEAMLEEYRMLGLPLRQIVFREGESGDDYYYTNRVAASLQITALTSEFCFIDNEEDQQFIDSEEDWQAQARAQCNAILYYFGQVEY